MRSCRQERPPLRLAVARRILAATPDIGLRELTRQIGMATRYRISESTAAKLRDELRTSGAAAKVADTDLDPNPAA